MALPSWVCIPSKCHYDQNAMEFHKCQMEEHILELFRSVSLIHNEDDQDGVDEQYTPFHKCIYYSKDKCMLQSS